MKLDELLAKELEQLQYLIANSAEYKIEALFTDRFPRSCSCCNKVYETRQDYLDQTVKLSAGSLIFNGRGIQEYRNCSCGSTMTIWGPDDDRRDMSQMGVLKRALFRNCVHKLVAHDMGTEQLVENALRKVFSEARYKKEA